MAAPHGETEAAGSSDDVAMDHIPPSPLMVPSAAVDKEEDESPFEDHADGAKLEGPDGDGSELDVDAREATDQVADSTEVQVSEEADDRPLEGGRVSPIGAGRERLRRPPAIMFREGLSGT